MAKMTLSRICAPARPRVFLRHSDTRSRVLLKGGDYSDPVLNSDLYQWLDENLDIEQGRASQGRALTWSPCHANSQQRSFLATSGTRQRTNCFR
jgi:hypothetical protein